MIPRVLFAWLVVSVTVASLLAIASCTREVPVTVLVEATRVVPVEIAMPVEVTREVPLELEVTREVMIEVPVEVAVPVEVTREVPLELAVTREVLIEVPVEVAVPVEVTREVLVEVPVEVTRIVVATPEVTATVTPTQIAEIASPTPPPTSTPTVAMVWRGPLEAEAETLSNDSVPSSPIAVQWYEWVPTVYVEDKELDRLVGYHALHGFEGYIPLGYDVEVVEIDEAFPRAPGVRNFHCTEPETYGYNYTLSFNVGQCEFFSDARRVLYSGGGADYITETSPIDIRDVVNLTEQFNRLSSPRWSGYNGMYWIDEAGIYDDDDGFIVTGLDMGTVVVGGPAGAHAAIVDVRGVDHWPNCNWKFPNDTTYGLGCRFVLGFGEMWDFQSEQSVRSLYLGTSSDIKALTITVDQQITDPQSLAVSQLRTFNIYISEEPPTFYVLDSAASRLYHHTGWHGASEWEFVSLPTDHTYSGVAVIRTGPDVEDDRVYLLNDSYIEERVRPDFALTRTFVLPPNTQNFKDLDSRPYQIFEIDLERENWQTNFEEFGSAALTRSDGALVLYILAENSDSNSKLYMAELPLLD